MMKPIQTLTVILIFSQIIAFSQMSKDSIKEQEKLIKVLIPDFIGGQFQLALLDIGKYLSKQSGFDVTILSDDLHPSIQISSSMHHISLKEQLLLSKSEQEDNEKKEFTFELLDETSRLTDAIFNHDFLNKLNSLQFDIIITSISPLESSLGHALNLEEIKYFVNFPQPITSIMTEGVTMMSIYYPNVLASVEFMRENELGGFKNRLFNMFSYLFNRAVIPVFAFPMFKLKKFLDEEFHQAVGNFNQMMLLGSGIEGMRDCEQVTPNIVSTYPINKEEREELSEFYVNTMKMFKKNVVISIDTSSYNDYQLKQIKSLISNNKDIGFFWSISFGAEEFFKIVSNYKASNLFIIEPSIEKSFLSNSQVNFMFHDCAELIFIESIYQGLPFLGFAKPENYYGYINCQRGESLGVAYSISINDNSTYLKQKFNSLVEDSDLSDNSRRLMMMMKFEEERGGKDIVYWLRYVNQFGVKHLINDTHTLPFYIVYDLDIVALIIIAVLVIWNVLKCLVCSRSKSFRSKSSKLNSD